MNELEHRYTPRDRDDRQIDGHHPEFGRWQDVERIFGIKRGTLYNLKNAGKIRSVSLRKPGQKFAVRLFHLPSIHDYLHQQMQEQEAAGEYINFEPSTDAGFDD